MADISPKIRTALSEFGFSEDRLTCLSAESLVVQDLGIWGDDFDELYEILSEIYGTKSQIDAKFCPGEFSWMRQPILWLPFVSIKKNISCTPLSLRRLDEIMSIEID